MRAGRRDGPPQCCVAFFDLCQCGAQLMVEPCAPDCPEASDGGEYTDDSYRWSPDDEYGD